MVNPIVWQQNSTNPANAENFASIGQWWQDLNLKEIFWQQRLIPDNGTVDDIDWEPQGFDEKFLVQMPQVRGITLYWHKSTFADERSMTPKQLVLDTEAEELYIYPQSQPKLVIRLAKPHLVYQKIECEDPLIVGKMTENNYILLVRDREQQIEVKITLSKENYRQLLENMVGE
ncbi:hypothetical protein V0288_24385 [Pannus brasiliensis CCIBt3594]|uniref:Uncharacterized protein n=1 Tax=Pannus brasiliensis CCIBt3594 TaxID=1427578 RepID=A0AAW9R1A0_9CHRO